MARAAESAIFFEVGLVELLGSGRLEVRIIVVDNFLVRLVEKL